MRVHSAEHLQSMLSSSPTPEDDRRDGSSPHPLSPVSARLIASPTQMTASQATCASHATSNASPSRRPSGARRARPKSAAAALPAREMLREQAQVQHERIIRRMRQQLDAKAKRAEREFQDARAKLEKERAFYVPQVNGFLKARQEEANRKAAALHHAWETHVFREINDRVNAAVDERRVPGERWRTAQGEYLRAVDRKEGGVFGEIIIAGEYDPLVCNTQVIKTKTKKIVDPLKTQLAEAQEGLPDGFAPRRGGVVDDGQPPVADGRKDALPPTLWAKLDATPYGRFEKLSNMEAKPAEERSPAKIRFDHYGYARGRAELDAEFPKGKKSFAVVR